MLHKDVPIKLQLLCLLRDLLFMFWMKEGIREKEREQVYITLLPSWLRSLRIEMRGHDCCSSSMGLSLGCAIHESWHVQDEGRTIFFLGMHACGKKTTHACLWMSPEYFPWSLFCLTLYQIKWNRHNLISCLLAQKIARRCMYFPSLCFTHADKKINSVMD